MRSSPHAVAPLALALLVVSCGAESETAPPPIRVAAAASLTAAFEALGRGFEAQTGQKVRFTFGASGSLAHQIEHGAPFDVFASADEGFVRRVVDAGACEAASAGPFTRGRLVVWTRPGLTPPRTLEELSDPRFSRVALANPEHAPFGIAARKALRRSALWTTIERRVVYAENVRQTLQFAQTGNVDAAFIAHSLVHDEPHLLVDEGLHDPITHSLAVCRGGARRDDARSFTRFMRSSAGSAVLAHFGLSTLDRDASEDEARALISEPRP